MLLTHYLASRFLTKAAFVAGLLLGPVLFLLVFRVWPAVRIEAPMPLLALAGLLVGFGTRLGSGCTSGHGVVGLARNAESLDAADDDQPDGDAEPLAESGDGASGE